MTYTQIDVLPASVLALKKHTTTDRTAVLQYLAAQAAKNEGLTGTFTVTRLAVRRRYYVVGDNSEDTRTVAELIQSSN